MVSPKSELTPDIVEEMLHSSDPFPVPFGQAFKWLGFSRKDPAKRSLVENFVAGFDYLVEVAPVVGRGRPSEIIRLTVDCFKALGMMAGTAKGREVRHYFIECERKLKEMEKNAPPVTCALAHPSGDNAKLIELAHRYQFGGGHSGKAKCREWIRSVGIGDDEWVQYSSPRDIRLPRHLLPRLDKEIQKVQGKEFVPVSNPTFVTPDPDNSIIVLHESVKLAEDRLSKITYLLQFAETEDMAIDLANEVLDGLIRAGAQFCGQVDSYRYVVDNIFADNLSLSQ